MMEARSIPGFPTTEQPENLPHTRLVVISQLEGPSVTTAKTFLTDALHFGTEISLLGICHETQRFLCKDGHRGALRGPPRPPPLESFPPGKEAPP